MFRNEVKYRVSFLLLTEHVTLDISMSILIVNISNILFYDKYDISEGMDVNNSQFGDFWAWLLHIKQMYETSLMIWW